MVHTDQYRSKQERENAAKQFYEDCLSSGNKAFAAYWKKQWMGETELWMLSARNGLRGEDEMKVETTTGRVERYHGTLKQLFLNQAKGRIKQRRMDWLIYMLVEKVLPYYAQDQKIERIKEEQTQKFTHGRTETRQGEEPPPSVHNYEFEDQVDLVTARETDQEGELMEIERFSLCMISDAKFDVQLRKLLYHMAQEYKAKKEEISSHTLTCNLDKPASRERMRDWMEKGAKRKKTEGSSNKDEGRSQSQLIPNNKRGRKKGCPMQFNED